MKLLCFLRTIEYNQTCLSPLQAPVAQWFVIRSVYKTFETKKNPQRLKFLHTSNVVQKFESLGCLRQRSPQLFRVNQSHERRVTKPN